MKMGSIICSLYRELQIITIIELLPGFLTLMVVATGQLGLSIQHYAVVGGCRCFLLMEKASPI
jgi:hypothetical protein